VALRPGGGRLPPHQQADAGLSSYPRGRAKGLGDYLADSEALLATRHDHRPAGLPEGPRRAGRTEPTASRAGGIRRSNRTHV
jgi:hypothetical protein